MGAQDLFPDNAVASTRVGGFSVNSVNYRTLGKDLIGSCVVVLPPLLLVFPAGGRAEVVVLLGGRRVSFILFPRTIRRYDGVKSDKFSVWASHHYGVE